MKFLAVIFLIGFGGALSKTKNLNLLARSFENITQKMFELNNKIVILNSGVKMEIVHLLVLRNVVYKLMSYELKEANNVSLTVDESAILTFDSMDSLKHFNNKVELTNKFPKTLVFFVFCLGATYKSILTLNEPLLSMREKRKGLFVNPNEMQHILQFQYFIVETENSIRLLTFVFYSPESCGEPKLIELNRFEMKTETWKHGKFSVEKFENFHRCPLVFGIWFQGFAMDYYIDENGSVWYSGYNIKFVDDLREILNFTSSWNPRLWPELTYLYKNLSVDLHAMEHCYNFYDDEDGVLSFITRPYIYKEHSLAVSPGEIYSGYEKLFLPFDLPTWILIIATFFAAFLTIFLLSFTTQKVRNFVFGRNVATPSLNVAAHFFGSSQVDLPVRNFARFLTMVFVMYSLVIRTAWQGKMFEFMQTHMTKPEIQSVKELIEKNYTFHLHYNFLDRYANMNIVAG